MEKLYQVVPLIWAQSKDGAIASDIISLKNYRQADFFLMLGGTVGQAAALTMKKGADVTTCTTALAFTRYYKTGCVLDYDGPSVDTPAEAAETVTGAAANATIYKDLGTRLILYAWDGNAFVDNETVTCSGGKTVVANGISKNEDILVPMTASSNTFNTEANANRLYKIPITSDMLGDGYDTVCLNLADANATLMAAWAVIYDARYYAEIPETAIYD